MAQAVAMEPILLRSRFTAPPEQRPRRRVKFEGILACALGLLRGTL